MSDREYQSRFIKELRAAIAAGSKRIIAVSPTGSGKGFLAARIMQMAAEKHCKSVFFADQRELVFQLNAHLKRMDIPSTVVMRGVNNPYKSREELRASGMCNVVAKDTLWSRSYRKGRMMLPQGQVVQVDEAHKSISYTYQSILKDYSDSVVIGWTATPCRTDGRNLGAFYDKMLQVATYKELQEQGYLVPVKIFAPDRPDLKRMRRSAGDYNRKDLQDRMNKDSMIGSIVEEWRKHSQDRQTIVFASGVKHSIALRDQFRRLGVTAEHVDGKMDQPTRDAIMSDARDGKIKVLCNYGVFHTGIDVPSLKYMICARPTKSFSLWRQMGGRIQRPYEGHDECVIQDHSDNALVYGYPDEDVEWDLNADEKICELHRKKKQKEGKSPKHCPECKKVLTAKVCPAPCGFKFPERKGKAIETGSGDLVALERKRVNRNSSQSDKQAYWDKMLGWAIGKNRKVGAASHRYKDKFGCWPNSSIQNTPKGKVQSNMNAKDFYNKVVRAIPGEGTDG